MKQLKYIFLIDGIGALVSAFLLAYVLVKFEAKFGIPKHALYLLASLPCLFGLYDLLAYHSTLTQQIKMLKGIAFLNIAYSLISISAAIYHRESLSIFGWTYIALEIIVILFLARFELKIHHQFKSMN